MTTMTKTLPTTKTTLLFIYTLAQQHNSHLKFSITTEHGLHFYPRNINTGVKTQE